MQLIIESVAETQKTSLAAVADFTDNYPLAIERMTQLHIEVSRTAFEQSAEIALLCLHGGFATDKMALWNTGLQSGIEQFSAYCRQVSQLANKRCQAPTTDRRGRSALPSRLSVMPARSVFLA
jgi:hypothetical protein